ncbi:PadR family transcriptional regulator [Reticulibacter mediterranei]|nr:PadR family transcriptional regulator [Reticulibacter mediterranei]
MMGTRPAFWSGMPRGLRMSRERGREKFGGEHARHHGGRGEGRFAFEGRHGGHFEEEPGLEPRGHHGRRRGRDGARVGRGDVRAALLLLLAEQPSHGYHLMQRVSERSGGVWQPSPGSVYPALQLLEDEGLVRVEQSEGRRVFHLTESGQAYVQEHREELTRAWSAVVGSVDDGEQELRGLFHQVGAALKQVMHEGTATQIASARTLLVNTRRQLYRILAEEEGSDVN